MSHDHKFVSSHATSWSRQMSPLAGWRKSASTLLPSPPVFALPKLPEAAAAHFIDVEKRRKNTDEKFVTWNNEELRFCLSFATALQLPRQHGELVRRQHRRLARCHPQQGTNAIEKKWILSWIEFWVNFLHWTKWKNEQFRYLTESKKIFSHFSSQNSSQIIFFWIGPQG